MLLLHPTLTCADASVFYQLVQMLLAHIGSITCSKHALEVFLQPNGAGTALTLK